MQQPRPVPPPASGARQLLPAPPAPSRTSDDTQPLSVLKLSPAESDSPPAPSSRASPRRPRPLLPAPPSYPSMTSNTETRKRSFDYLGDQSAPEISDLTAHPPSPLEPSRKRPEPGLPQKRSNSHAARNVQEKCLAGMKSGGDYFQGGPKLAAKAGDIEYTSSMAPISDATGFVPADTQFLSDDEEEAHTKRKKQLG
ncbi:hypothetical protein MMC28_010537 [Mycoblastus sanguinarius]|nr:hypothetical protein [Mycoblastus sanguinarius]